MSARSGVYRQVTAWAQLQDEFTKDAEFFDIAVPSTYGCISGCSMCRDFRSAVRAAREQYDATFAFAPYFSSFPFDDDGCEDCRLQEPTGEAINEVIGRARSSLLVSDMTTAERIVAALNLSNGDFPTARSQELADSLIERLLD